jgi:phage protein D
VRLLLTLRKVEERMGGMIAAFRVRAECGDLSTALRFGRDDSWGGCGCAGAWGRVGVRAECGDLSTALRFGRDDSWVGVGVGVLVLGGELG